MPKLQQLITEGLRLAVLGIAAEVPQGFVNECVLLRGVEALGYPVSRDRLLTEIAWLEEQSLIETSSVQRLMLVKIKRRGADAASGRATVPGVERPEIL